jgi:hypothetical protein
MLHVGSVWTILELPARLANDVRDLRLSLNLWLCPAHVNGAVSSRLTTRAHSRRANDAKYITARHPGVEWSARVRHDLDSPLSTDSPGHASGFEIFSGPHGYLRRSSEVQHAWKRIG